MTKRPNFVLFVTDQQRADFLGCTGHPVLRTPNIDTLAEQGVIWDRFFVASPVCMVNRASLMTSRYPSSHGLRVNGNVLDRRHVTFVEQLRDAGYQTALIGKNHLQNFLPFGPHVMHPDPRPGFGASSDGLREAVRHDQWEPFYTQERRAHLESRPVDLPFYGFDHVDLLTGHGDHVGGDYRRWLMGQNPDADQLVGEAHQLDHDYSCPQAVRTALPEELYSTSYIADKASEWLRAAKADGRPYFLMISFPDPHHPFNPPGRYWDMYAPDDMQVPAAFKDEAWQPPLLTAEAIRRREKGQVSDDPSATLAVTQREAQEARALTCGMISMIDDAVGKVLALVDAETTVRIFTSDHGDHLGDHRLLLKGAEQYEQITRVPFLWADPDGPKGERTDAIGQTLDIGVSILERAHIEPSVGMQGIALTKGGREAALIQFEQQSTHPVLGPAPRVHTVRSPRWRMTVLQGFDRGELYDLAEDPDELRNLWDDPGAAQAKHEMTALLLRLELAAIDRVPLPVGAT